MNTSATNQDTAIVPLEAVRDRVDAVVAQEGREATALIAILRAIQHEFHYLPRTALLRVHEKTGIPLAAIAGVASFYRQFRQEPAGEHRIRVCIGTACHVKGAEDVFAAFKRELGIPEDADTNRERRFTVEKVACLGCCMLAPAVQIDDVTYGFLTPSKVPEVLHDFLRGLTAPKAAQPKPVGSDAYGTVRLCLCSSCRAGGSQAVYDRLCASAVALRLPLNVAVVGCTGISYQTPLVEIVTPNGRRFLYGRVGAEDVQRMLLRHFVPRSTTARARAWVSRSLERLLTDASWTPVVRFSINVRSGPDAAYVGPQKRIATEFAGELNPLDLGEYGRGGGFEALRLCAADMAPAEIIAAIRESGLRGRGGAGYNTAKKWAAVRANPGLGGKCVICNGDEGDPGAFMDRMLLESFPFRVLEGMAIAGRAVGAETGYAYIRAEYPLAAQRLRAAVARCEEAGLLGPAAAGGTAFQVQVVEGAGAFVCGEETALIAAIEGRRGMPRVRPPYPAEFGLHGRPTLVNNVETFALVPWILRNGPRAFAGIGTEASAGTKTFALAGKIRHGGLIEVPMGMSLRAIVEEIGGGIQDGRALKAVQVGGPSGGCIPARLCETPVDYEALAKLGAIMGSGGMVVLDDTDCMVEVARYFMAFTQMESCGKCTYCRIGTRRMLGVLERLCQGDGTAADIRELEHLAGITQRGSLCGLGSTAPNPVLSTLRYFRDEYDAHVRGHCPAKRCKALITYTIGTDCIGCTRCAQRCPADAIAGTAFQRHEIDPDACVRCDTCRQVCPAAAVKVE